MQITDNHNKAANDIIELISATIGTNRQVHSATAISACARIAGSMMYRSFNFKINDVKPGTVMLSNEANEKGPQLINVVGNMLTHFGFPPKRELMETNPKAESNLSFLDTMDKLQAPTYSIMMSNNLDFEQMSYACALATAFIIKECRNDLNLESGFNTAIWGFMDGTKTCPPVLAT